MDNRSTQTTHQLLRKNASRMTIILSLIFIVEALFLFYVERLRLLNATGDDIELIKVTYLLHLILALFSITMAVYFHFMRTYKPKHIKWLERIPLITVFIVLSVTATINLFDQMTTGHITVFTVQLLLFGLLIYIKPPYQILIYGLPYLLFSIGVLVFQDNTELLSTNMINATVIFAGIVITSHNFYKTKIYQIQYHLTLKHLNKKLEALSTLDPLTKLPNRRHFKSQIKYEVAINRRYNHEASLVIVDIDHFKDVNDTHGHHAGDMILKALGAFLKDNVRESDTVARWGGEEFMLLLSHTDLEGARILSERLRKKIETLPFMYEDAPISITVSAGITRLDHETDEGFKESYKRADKALYKAKTQGRNQVIVIEKSDDLN